MLYFFYILSTISLSPSSQCRSRSSRGKEWDKGRLPREYNNTWRPVLLPLIIPYSWLLFSNLALRLEYIFWFFSVSSVFSLSSFSIFSLLVFSMTSNCFLTLGSLYLFNFFCRSCCSSLVRICSWYLSPLFLLTKIILLLFSGSLFSLRWWCCKGWLSTSLL